LVHYGRSAKEAESRVSEIQTQGGRANAISAELGTPNGAEPLAKQVRSIIGDRLDVVVLNAGISKAARIADYTAEDFDNLFATNVRSPFFLVQQLVPILGEGSNIIVSSSLKTANDPGGMLDHESEALGLSSYLRSLLQLHLPTKGRIRQC
jgi:NAD(P)-dependent dehydrogenase (short-subunit alcohol dehydrogenase family)